MTTKYKKILVGFISIGLILSALSIVRIYFRKTVTITDLEQYTDFTMDTLPIQNMAITVTENNDVTFSKQYGESIDEKSNFIIGSVSKSFTASAVMQLANRNKLNLENSASNYLPKHILPENIRILDLLNHTSGISAGEKIDAITFNGVYGKFEYSNANYNLLGKIVESVTNEDFSAYINQEVFSKLGMRNSFALNDQTKSTIVQGYNSFYGIPVALNPSIPKTNSFIQAPSGYLCSNTYDLTKYVQHCLSSKDLLDQVKQLGVKVKNDPALEGMFQDEGIYGLGWIYKTIDGTDILYHTGKTPTFNSLVVLIPEKNIGLSILYSYGDFLVGTSMIEQVNESIVDFLLKESITVTKTFPTSYITQHLVINLFLLLFALVCSIVSLKKYDHTKKFKSLFLLALQVLLLVTLVTLIKLMSLPLDVLLEFVPDIFIVLLYCFLVLFLGSGRNIYLLVKNSLLKH